MLVLKFFALEREFKLQKLGFGCQEFDSLETPQLPHSWSWPWHERTLPEYCTELKMRNTL